MASDEEKTRVVLWTSHVLVMHKDSHPEGSSLRPMGWSPDTPQTRNRDEARRIAADLARRAQAHPEQFADLARQNSDDAVTRDQGGSLGGLNAIQLPAAFLDALAILKAGQTSAVLSTSLGFHVILKRSPPPTEQVRALRILVRYSTTFGHEPTTRTREEAMALARKIVVDARAGVPFSELIQQYSDGPEKSRRGEMGAWVTTTPMRDPTVVEVLAGLGVDQISDPIDTRFGFQIAKRLGPSRVPDPEFGARFIQLEYDADTLGSSTPNSQSVVRQEAEQLREELSGAPDAFDALRRGRCCEAPQRWFDGHGDPTITSVIAKTQIGQVVDSAVPMGTSFLVVQRLDPNLLAPMATTTYSVPKPEDTDVESLVASNTSDRLAHAVDEFGGLLPRLALSSDENKIVLSALAKLKADFSSAKEADPKVFAFREALRALHKNLSEATYARVFTGIQDWVSAQRMATPYP